MDGGEFNIHKKIKPFQNDLSDMITSEKTSKEPKKIDTNKLFNLKTEQKDNSSSKFKHIIVNMFKYHKLVNDTAINPSQRIKYRDLMYNELYKMYRKIDFVEYDNYYNQIHNNEIDNNFKNYFTLAA